MKVFIAIAIVAFAAVNADISDHIKPPSNFNPDFFRNQEILCKDIFNVTEEEIKAYETDRISLSEQKLCYWKCTYMHQGTMNKDGIYNRKFIEEITGHQWPAAAMCLDTYGEDVCNQAQNTYGCYLSNRLIPAKP